MLASSLAEVDIDYVENVEIVCYPIGGYYYRHFDGGDRSHTLSITLNTEFEGGQDYFNQLDALISKIPCGTGLFYENLNRMDNETRMVTTGEKWVLMCWVNKNNSDGRVENGRDLPAHPVISEDSPIILP